MLFEATDYVRKVQEWCTVHVSVPQVNGITHHSDHHVLDVCSLPKEFSLAFRSPRAVHLPVINRFFKDIVDVRDSHCCDVLVGCQRKRLTVTSACDLGVVCHIGLFQVTCRHGQGVALSQQAHACTRFLQPFPSFSTVDDS